MTEKRPKRVPRVSMRGMGADAFFNPPAIREDDTPGSQQDSIPVKQQDGVPGEQYTGELVRQDTRKPAEQQAGTYMKATYYIKPEQDLQLEQLRLARRQRGERVDKSALIREAIDLLIGGYGNGRA